MKKLVPVLLALSIVLSFVLSASAMEHNLPEPIQDNVTESITDFPYFIIYGDIEFQELVLSSTPFIVDDNLHVIGHDVIYCELQDGQWVGISQAGFSASIEQIVWTSHDLYRGDTLIFSHDKTFFGGSPSLNESTSSVINDTLYNDTLPTIGGVLTVLTVVGVGILGMFVAFKLIGRRSLINK